MTEKDRHRYELTVYEGRDETNRQRLQDELDAFWTYGPQIKRCRQRDVAGQVWVLEADEGFNDTWREENEVDLRTTIRDDGPAENSGMA